MSKKKNNRQNLCNLRSTNKLINASIKKTEDVDFHRTLEKKILLTVHDILVYYLHKHKLYLIDNPMDTNDNFLALLLVHKVHQLYHFYKHIYNHLLLIYIVHFYRMDLDYMYEVD